MKISQGRLRSYQRSWELRAPHNKIHHEFLSLPETEFFNRIGRLSSVAMNPNERRLTVRAAAQSQILDWSVVERLLSVVLPPVERSELKGQLMIHSGLPRFAEKRTSAFL